MILLQAFIRTEPAHKNAALFYGNIMARLITASWDGSGISLGLVYTDELLSFKAKDYNRQQEKLDPLLEEILL